MICRIDKTKNFWALSSDAAFATNRLEGWWAGRGRWRLGNRGRVSLLEEGQKEEYRSICFSSGYVVCGLCCTPVPPPPSARQRTLWHLEHHEAFGEIMWEACSCSFFLCLWSIYGPCSLRGSRLCHDQESLRFGRTCPSSDVEYGSHVTLLSAPCVSSGLLHCLRFAILCKSTYMSASSFLKPSIFEILFLPSKCSVAEYLVWFEFATQLLFYLGMDES